MSKKAKNLAEYQIMFGKTFGKRKSKPIPILLPDSCRSVEAEVWSTTSAIVEYVNFLTQQGLFLNSELPAPAVNFYYADYYYAQVCNGGHSQFVHNARDPNAILEMAAISFNEMGLPELAKTATQLNDWIKQKPQDAGEQDGFGNRHPDLEALDTAFFRSIKNDVYFNHASRYFWNLKNVRFVAKETYAEALGDLVSLNDNFKNRETVARIGAINANARDVTRAGISIAAFNADPELIVERINAGRPTKIDGEETFLWGLTTNKGFLWGCVYSKAAFVAPRTNDGVGEPLEMVPTGLVAAGVDHATKFNIGAIIVELLAIAGISENALAVFCALPPGFENAGGTEAVYLVITQSNVLRALIDVKTSALFEFDKLVLLSKVDTEKATEKAARLSEG